MDTVLHRAREISSGTARAARYVAVGAFGTALYYAALVLQVEAMRVGVMAATCVAFMLVVVVNYILQRMWTFRSPVAHRRAFLPFVAMSVAGFGINSAVMALGLEMGVHYLLVQALAIGIVVAWNYIFMTRIFDGPAALTKGFSNDPNR